MGISEQRQVAEEIAARIVGLGEVRVARFFGGASLSCDGIQFAMVMKGVLYLRVDEPMRAELSAMGARPFIYQGASGPVTASKYYEAPADALDDGETLQRWALRAYEAAREVGRGAPRAGRDGVGTERRFLDAKGGAQ
jgi:DNA transformation protein and related proteins